MTSHATLKKRLASLLNEFSFDTECNIPDYVLAEHALHCLLVFKRAVRLSDDWHDKKISAVTRGRAAEMLSVSVGTIYNMARSGEIEMIHIGRASRITVSSIESFLEKIRRREHAKSLSGDNFRIGIVHDAEGKVLDVLTKGDVS